MKSFNIIWIFVDLLAERIIQKIKLKSVTWEVRISDLISEVKEIWKRLFIIFALSFTVELGLLYGTNKIRKRIVREKMIAYPIASKRTSDNAENHVVMNGISGHVGMSVYLQYLEDGYIRIVGDSMDKGKAWKLLSRLSLEPGVYTLTGMMNVAENTVAFQIYLSDDSGE